ncbi:ceramidase domain-containing protein [Candidatus Uabimicrobium sp. HlEnr_7]|uniref:ceramidase domain-containing protein n=1 Tax=Candidatus Uabimicrobium helgolandensis TaxID=3095367 RepID=UPI00355933C1
MPIKIKDYTTTIFIFLSITTTMIILSSIEYSWDHWRRATCFPNKCFCEALHSGTIVQPVNTWSNLAFIFIGLLVLHLGKQDFLRRPFTNGMCNKRIYPLTYGGLLIFLGLSSSFYHASMTFVGQVFDLMGMYLLTTFILLYNIERLRPYKAWVFLLCYAFINIVLLYILLILPQARRYIFALLVIVALVPEYFLYKKKNANNRLLFLAVGLLIIAFIVWILDVKKIICAPHSFWQGHALWHVLTALSAGTLYLHYRSEV